MMPHCRVGSSTRLTAHLSSALRSAAVVFLVATNVSCAREPQAIAVKQGITHVRLQDVVPNIDCSQCVTIETQGVCPSIDLKYVARVWGITEVGGTANYEGTGHNYYIARSVQHVYRAGRIDVLWKGSTEPSILGHLETRSMNDYRPKRSPGISLLPNASYVVAGVTTRPYMAAGEVARPWPKGMPVVVACRISPDLRGDYPHG